MSGTLLNACALKADKIGDDVSSDKYRQKLKVIEINLTDEDYGVGIDKDNPELLNGNID